MLLIFVLFYYIIILCFGERKMEEKDDAKKIKLSNKYYIHIAIFLFIVVISILLSSYKNGSSRSKYVYLENRENYIIQNVNEQYLQDYYGNENTMVVFSASWCKYCVEEQKDLNNFIVNNPEKKVIIVSHDDSYENLEKYLKANNFNWFVIFDKDKTIKKHIDPNVNGIPCTYLLDKNGKIIGFSKGVKTEEQFLKFYNNEIDIY
jgi:peroxiredoxin